MHDRAMDPIGAPTSATATATEIIILLSITSACITSETAGRGKRSSAPCAAPLALLFFRRFSFAFLPPFCEEEGDHFVVILWKEL
jgi:hypothetical protein